MVATLQEDAWMEKCFIAICPIGGTEKSYHGLTETVDIDPGEKGIEGIPLVNGGRIRRWSPQTDGEITFEAYPIFAGTDSGSTGKGFFDLMHAADASTPIRIPNDFNRTKHRIAILWTNDTTVSSATTSTTNTYSGFRFVCADAIITSVKASFTDGVLKFTITAKWTAFDKNASANAIYESCEGSGAGDILPALAAYTSSYKFS